MVDSSKETALGLGERLRSARKARALTLEQAAFSIRLEASVLRALEDERYEVLGAAVFVRGHLKAYARLLGLSEEAVMAAYRAADPNADAPAKVTRELEKPLTTTLSPVSIGLAVIIAIVAMLLLYVLGGSKEPARRNVAAPDPSPVIEVVPAVDLAPTGIGTPGAGSVAEPGSALIPAPSANPESSAVEPSEPAATPRPAEAVPAGNVE